VRTIVFQWEERIVTSLFGTLSHKYRFEDSPPAQASVGKVVAYLGLRFERVEESKFWGHGKPEILLTFVS